MIKIKNLKKQFNTDVALDDLSINLPRTGIAVFYGPSGCGKTTLLNIIGLLHDFDGSISVDGKDIKKFNQKQIDSYRNQKIGFVFQDFKLFENETVDSNLMLALDIKCQNTKLIKNKRINDLLNIVSLSNKKNEKVYNLSGGEKQRLAIARAISNSPSILLADEPTGNLDEINGKLIMELLAKISKNSLVIVVSHDEKLTKEFGDIIVRMEDGKIKSCEYTNHNKIDERIKLIKVNNVEKKAKLPFIFCIKHTFHKFGERKWRTIFSFLTTSLALIGVGLGTVLSSIVSTNLTKSYSSVIDQNNVIVNSKENNNTRSIIEAANLDEVIELKNQYDDVDYGVYYWNNFELFFTEVSLNLEINNQIKFLPDFSIRHINDFKDISKHKNVIYPIQQRLLNDNQIVLCFDYPTLNEVCYQFHIEKTIESLGKIIGEYGAKYRVEVSNSNWSYFKEFSFDVVGVTLSNTNLILHSNKLWNEYVFEKILSLPATKIINENTNHPWDLKKSYFLEFKSERDEFLKKLKFDKKYRYFKGEILSKNYYPFLERNNDIFESNRIAILLCQKLDNVPGFYFEYIKQVCNHVKGVLFGNINCISIFPDNLLMGFGRQIFVSKDSNYLNSIIDTTSYIKESESHNINLAEEVCSGYFTQSGSSGVVYNSNYSLIFGRYPIDYGEIVISYALANKIGISLNSNSLLYFAYPIKEEVLNNGYISRDYKIIDLKVVGISDSPKFELNHDIEWPIIFYQSRIGLSIFDLFIDSIALSVEDGFEELTVKQLEMAFPNLCASCPISSVKDSINDVCGYIEKILLIASFLSLIICVCLLIMCENLYFREIKKDIGLVRCLGVSKKESKKFIYSHSLLTIAISFLFALIELLFICMILSKTMSKILNVEAVFIFNPMSIIYMLSISLLITILSTIFTSLKMNRYSALECLY